MPNFVFACTKGKVIGSELVLTGRQFVCGWALLVVEDTRNVGLLTRR
jgi:hypothetical protein